MAGAVDPGTAERNVGAEVLPERRHHPEALLLLEEAAGGDDTPPSFVEIQGHAVESASFELVVPGGVVVRVPVHFDESELSRLLKAVMPS